MKTLWMVGIMTLAAGFLVPATTAGQFGYTFDCDGLAQSASGDVFEAAISRHQVPNTADVLYLVQIIVPLTDTVVEEELFLGTDNFISWAADQMVFNHAFVGDDADENLTFHMEGAQTGKSVSGHGTFTVEGRSYTFVAYPKTSLQ
jgi:hypothetical protein